MYDAFYVSTTCFQILCSLSLYIIMGSCQSDVTLNCFQYVSKECIKTWACGSFFAANRLVMASIQKSFEGQKMHRYVKRSFTLNLQSIGSLFYRFKYFQKKDQYGNMIYPNKIFLKIGYNICFQCGYIWTIIIHYVCDKKALNYPNL